MKLFLDTNVLIDFILERPVFYLPTAMIVSFAVEGKIELSASSMSVVTANFICVERSKMPLDNFRKKIDFLREYLVVTSVGSADIYQSYDAKWKDFEDGVQYASAKRWGADYVVTRNIKDFDSSCGDIITPDEACLILQDLE